jgi:hypothetical protein
MNQGRFCRAAALPQRLPFGRWHRKSLVLAAILEILLRES